LRCTQEALSFYGKGAGGYFARADNFERNEALLRAKYPDLKDKPIGPLDLNFNIPPLIVTQVE